ncbi:hypothetical protein [Enterococcus casseliflavus]|uniref:hypothetical protein n=1 Tax=Enterococcus casseliflavus TaxID=37734 RepID=UPI0022E06FFD|nr:hypothetical protein [Enterococcus casseliflavus]
MNLTINKGGHITDRKEIHINGKAVETDGLVDAMVLQRKGKPAQLILTYDIDDLYIDDLGVGEGTGSITAGTIKVADIKTPNIPRTDIKVDGITARTIKAHGTTVHDIDRLAKQIAKQTADEMHRSLK